MQIEHLKRFYEGLKGDGIIFSFSGPLSQVILEGIGETIRKKMKMELTKLGTIQRVFSVFIEQTQNIMNYSAEITPSVGGGEDEIKAGVLVLGFQDERYYVCCGNYITREKVEPLARDLSMIRELEPEALRNMYRERRRADPPADSLGAGLGFFEIARRSTAPIAFDVQPLNDKIAFFAVKAVI